MTQGAPLVEVRDAWYRYPSGIVGLAGVSLTLVAGEVLGVAGGNGAGKSTLACLLNGLLRPSTGSVFVDGIDSRRTPVHELARTVGLVFQHPRTQLFARTVADELAFGPRNLGLPEPEVQRRVTGVAARLGLEDVLATSPFALPGPRRRLVTIASVLAMEPRVLVLDEPTTGQDQHTFSRVVAIIESARDAGVAIVCITHDMRLVASVATRMIAMAGGRVVAAGTPREVFSDGPAMAAASLLAPQSTRLAAAMARLSGLPAILTVDELVGALAPDPPSGTAAG